MPVLALPSQTSGTTSFIINPQDVQGTQITTHFDTLPGNQPNAYANTLFVWQTSSQMIPINTSPLYTSTIVSVQPNGSQQVQNISISSSAYLVGFAVGPNVANIVSTVFIPATGGGAANPQSSNSIITVTNYDATSVSFAYNTPPGSQPLANGDWVGLWQGQTEAALYSIPPDYMTQINTAAYQGNWGINLPGGGKVIQRGTPYTLGYFKGGYAAQNPKQTTLSCWASFVG